MIRRWFECELADGFLRLISGGWHGVSSGHGESWWSSRCNDAVNCGLVSFRQSYGLQSRWMGCGPSGLPPVAPLSLASCWYPVVQWRFRRWQGVNQQAKVAMEMVFRTALLVAISDWASARVCFWWWSLSCLTGGGWNDGWLWFWRQGLTGVSSLLFFSLYEILLLLDSIPFSVLFAPNFFFLCVSSIACVADMEFLFLLAMLICFVSELLSAGAPSYLVFWFLERFKSWKWFWW